jgi:uncharacterized membrane protein YhaH (DUF805 family)
MRARSHWEATLHGYEYLFGASGRFDRTEFWTTTVLFMVVFPIAAIACLIVWYWWAAPGVHRSFDAMMAAMIVVLTAGLIMAGISLLAMLAANVKRMHDRGRSGVWVALFWIVPIASACIGIFAPATVGQLLTLAALATALWGIVEMGFLRGTDGPNEYGAPAIDEPWGGLHAIDVRPLAPVPVVPPAAPRSGD